MKKGVLIICWLFLAWRPVVLAQEKAAPSDNDLVQQLSEAYNQFEYEKSSELLNIAFNSLDRFAEKDQIEIYKFAAFIAFQKGNRNLATNHFWNLLNIDPTYSLDPVTTSPKLMALFQKTKVEFLEEMNRRLNVLQRGEVKRMPWRSLFPGWEQWHRGYKAKGAVFAGAGVVAISAAAYSIVLTKQKKGTYLSEVDALLIKSRYEDYNRFYRQQFYFAYGFAAIWALSQIDLTLWSQPRISLKSSTSLYNPDGLFLIARVEF